jgi:cytochrome oxidase Cu insertion factor (SCO1/SenC/PrrC family)
MGAWKTPPAGPNVAVARRGGGACGRWIAGLTFLVLCVWLAPTAFSAADLEDLLWDLQIIPLEGVAANFGLEDLEGRQVSLNDFRGRAVLLYFWATW